MLTFLFFIFCLGNRCEYSNLLGMHWNSQLGLICLHFLGGRGGERGDFYCQRNILFKEFVLGGDEQEYRPFRRLVGSLWRSFAKFCQSNLKIVFNLTS